MDDAEIDIDDDGSLASLGEELHELDDASIQEMKKVSAIP